MFCLLRRWALRHPSEIERIEAKIGRLRAEEKPFLEQYREAEEYLSRVKATLFDVKRYLDGDPSLEFTPKHLNLSEFRCDCEMGGVPLEGQREIWERVLITLSLRCALAEEGSRAALLAYEHKQEQIYVQIVALQDRADKLQEEEQALANEAMGAAQELAIA